MLKFLFGAAAVLIVQAVGVDTFTSALASLASSAHHAGQRALSELEHATPAQRGSERL